jgi:hypothetical protein
MGLMRRDAIWIVLLGLIVNGLAAGFIVRPAYMDAYYYFGGALQLARGLGFTEPYVWNYLGPIRSLPAPSHLYWMPLASIVAAPFITLAELIAGPLPNDALFNVAQIPFVVIASALPLLSYGVAQSTTGLRRHAIVAALLTLFSAYYFLFWTNIDAFALFALLAGGALFSYGRAMADPGGSPRHWLLLCGLLAGLAHLSRADGMLVSLCILVYGAWHVLRNRPAFPSRTSLLFLPVLGYVLIMAPWFMRNWLAVGTPLAPGGTRTFWLVTYDDLFSYPAESLTLARYLAAGWPKILQDKWESVVQNFGNLVAVQSNIVAFPFALIGWWHLRRRPVYQLALLYGLALFAAMSLAFTLPGPRGGYIHSGGALLPFIYPAALMGLDAVVDAIARRLRHWQPEKSKPIFTLIVLMSCVALTGYRFLSSAIGPDWRRPTSSQADVVYAEIGAWLAREAAGQGEAIVAANNPPAFYYMAGRPSIVVPNGTPEALLEVMSLFGAHWAVLDANHPEGLVALYQAPTSEPRLQLRATFKNGEHNVYLFERVP